MHLVCGPYSTKIKHDGQTYAIDLAEVEFYRCEECGKIILPDEADVAIGREYRRVAGLLTPEEIRGKREELALTQRQLAERFGVAVETLERWESGDQIQQKAFDGWLRAFFDLPPLQHYLAHRASPSTLTADPRAGLRSEVAGPSA